MEPGTVHTMTRMVTRPSRPGTNTAAKSAFAPIAAAVCLERMVRPIVNHQRRPLNLGRVQCSDSCRDRFLVPVSRCQKPSAMKYEPRTTHRYLMQRIDGRPNAPKSRDHKLSR